MKTYTAKAGEVEHGWVVVDAQDKVLGRLATQIARAAARQAQARIHAARRHRRLHRRRQRREAARHRHKAERKIYYRHTRLSRRHQGDELRQAAGRASRARAGEGGEGHAAQGPARLRDAEEAQGLRRRHASAFGAAAQGTGDLDTWSATTTTAPAAARARSRACSSSPARATSSSTASRSTSSSARETGRMVVRQPLELTKNAATLRHHGQRLRRRRDRPGRRGAPRHHARADRVRCGAEAHAERRPGS